MAAPNLETLAGVLAPDAANFLAPFSIRAAAREHAAFRALLEGAGARVVDVREALAALPRAALIACARSAVAIEPGAGLPGGEGRIERAIAQLEAAELADLIMLQPTVELVPNPAALDPTSAYRSRLRLEPLSNAYYVRDPLTTTVAGAVVGRLRLAVRAPETSVAAAVLAALGVEPILRIVAPGTLEGGDFIPCGEFALQGVGLLTNRDGVAQMLAAHAYGPIEVALVIDEAATMDAMHLDTYFAMLDRDLAIVCEDRRGPRSPRVEVYVPSGTGATWTYERAATQSFEDYLRSKGIDIVTFTTDERRGLAPNGVLLGPRHYAYVAGAGAAFAARLRARNVTARPLDYTALACGYGGPHCSTQMVVRG